MNNESFWMVYVEGNRAPEKKHETQKFAEEEAERLAIANPCKKVYVLQTVKYCEVRNIVWDYTTDIPF